MKYAHVSMPRDLPSTPASAVDHEHQDVYNKIDRTFIDRIPFILDIPISPIYI